MRLDHIGFVVKDINQFKDYYIKTFLCKPLTGIVDEPAHGVEIMFLETGYGDMPMIELIAPVSKKSKVSAFLEKTGGGIHHLAYEVENIHESINHFKSLGSLILGDIVPGAGHHNTPTVWLYTSEKSLVELIQKQDEKQRPL